MTQTRPKWLRWFSAISCVALVFFSAGVIPRPAKASSLTTWSSSADFDNNAVTTGNFTSKASTVINSAGVTLGYGFAKVAISEGTLFSSATAYGIKSDGTLWSWGSNYDGELGQGTTDNSSHPTPTVVPGSTNWQSISGRQVGAVAIKTDGTLWAWGDNSSGGLGQGTTDNSVHSSPIRVGTDTDWASVSAEGSNSVLAIKKDGTLWAWGDNSSGQLGLGDTTNRTTPTQVGNSKNWKQVSVAVNFTTAVKTDGTLWAWGNNSSGQLSQGDNTARTSPTQIGGSNTWRSVTAASTSFGGAYALALQNNGTLWAWGDNSSGQLGLGNNSSQNLAVMVGSDSNWLSIFSGAGVSTAVKTNGTLWAWGSTSGGALGYGVSNSSGIRTPVQIGADNNWATVRTGGNRYIVSVGIKSDGSLFTWGDNTKGQLGLGVTGATEIFNQPRQVGLATNWLKISSGGSHSLGIKTDGTLWAWGNNIYGQLGLGDNTPRITPTQVGSATNWQSIATSGTSSYAIKTNGTLWVWGSNTSGQLGLGDSTDRSTPTQIGVGTDWQEVAAGSGFALGLKTGGTIWSWGDNTYGQLGQGDTNPRNLPTQIGALTTWAHVYANGNGESSYAIKANGTLWSWGFNNNGQLGQGTNDDNAHPNIAQAGTDTDWLLVAPGANHVLALKTDNTLWSWGYNGFGQLGQGNTTELHSPTQVGSDNNWQTPSAGTYISSAVKSNGTLYSWGLNNSGQLGLGSSSDQYTPTQIGVATDWQNLSMTSYSSLATKSTGTLWSWGENRSAQLGYPNTQFQPNSAGAGTVPASGTLSQLQLDAGTNYKAAWQSLNWSSTSLPVNTSIEFRVQTSDDNVTYTAYSPASIQTTLGSTSGTADLSGVANSRYIQIQATLKSSDGTNKPVLTGLSLTYSPTANTVNNNAPGGSGAGGGGTLSPIASTPTGLPTTPQVITTPATTPVLASNELVLDRGVIYLIQGQTKFGFSSMKVFNGLGYNMKNVFPASTAAITKEVVLSNVNQAHVPGSWVINKKTVYYMSTEGLIPVPSWDVFLSNGGKEKYLVEANKVDLKMKTLPPLKQNDSRVK